jgi:alkanesulfonate monooxygenase SsuD/methylene tetrahydromethanopterin reductase-like flavin-dependent oxidoreductase (luciferase family)
LFPHVPGKFFDIITFELKPFDSMDVTAVFEALSHRRAATQAYVWLHVPAGEASNADLIALLKRIEEEASRHGAEMIVGARRITILGTLGCGQFGLSRIRNP